MISSIGQSNFDPTEMAQKLFKKVDTDGDGSVSKSELQEMLKNRKKDSNVSDTENTEELDEIYSKLDTDSSGDVSQSELEEGMKASGPPPPPPPPADMMKSIVSSLSSSSSDDSSTQNILDILTKVENGEEITDEDKSTLHTFVNQLQSTIGSSGTTSDSNWKGLFVNSLQG